MMTPENVRADLAKLIANRSAVDLDLLFNYSGAFPHLHEILAPEERLRGYCFSNIRQTGKSLHAGKWLTVATIQRLIFLLHSPLKGTIHFSLPLDSITAWEPKFGWLFAGLSIHIAGSTVEMFHAGKTDLKCFVTALDRILPRRT